jgi:hypothetical protein
MHALEASMNPNGEIRKAAEKYINDNQRTPGYVIALANISANKQVNYQIALAAAVQLGTLVEHHWKFRDETHAQKLVSQGF